MKRHHNVEDFGTTDQLESANPHWRQTVAIMSDALHAHQPGSLPPSVRRCRRRRRRRRRRWLSAFRAGGQACRPAGPPIFGRGSHMQHERTHRPSGGVSQICWAKEERRRGEASQGRRTNVRTMRMGERSMSRACTCLENA